MSNLNEGLIGVPPVMLDKIKKYIRKNILWWASDRLKNKSRDFPELFKGLKSSVKKYNVVIPSDKYEGQAYAIPVDLQGMGPKYENLSPTVEKIILYFDHNRTDMMGFWWPEKNALILCPMAVDFIKNYPSGRNDPEDIELAIDQIITTAEHELRHMVQYIVINQPEQIKRKEKYNDNGDDYFTSPLEFDPTIGTNVGMFMKFVDLYSERKPITPQKMALFVKQFVGAEPSSRFDMFAVTPFFKSLKKTSPVKYKIAVKKFITEIQNELRNRKSKSSY